MGERMMTQMATQANESGLFLSVLSGAHAGAAARVASGRDYLVGSGADCDLVLTDSQVERRAVRLHAGGSRLHVEALASVTLDDGSVLDAGRQRKIDLPARLCLGESVHLCVDLATVCRSTDGRRLAVRPPTTRRTGRRVAVVAPLVLIASLALVLSADGERFASSASTVVPALPPLVEATPPTTRPLPAVAATLLPAAPESQPDDVGPPCESAAKDLADRLAGASITGLVPQAHEGAVRVTGVLGPEQSGLWRDIQLWFDGTHGARVPLIVDLGTEAAPAEQPFAVRAIFLGEPAHVIARDGTRYRVGSTTPEGWRVESIGDGAVEVSRDGRRVRVTL